MIKNETAITQNNQQYQKYLVEKPDSSIFLPKYKGHFFLFKDTNDIPIMTANAPNNCNHVNFSFKKMAAKIMVEMGPTAAMTAKFEELIIFMDADTKNDGITVANMAIKNPSK
ncbi:hypothetical protein GCM10007962_07280 [Yeosuana aromativorans]|uniref:Uncharacterized protein n=1 Tax=Yeosuana aromativorans TaxID=288019 RepID=A0A8J3FE66_9FLAO|nr:hypothetical protein GCM10007962_07280 [Yeosuana aromativorans]